MEKQKMRFTDLELDLIRRHFKDNEAGIKTLRKIFLQFPLSEEDKGWVKLYKSRDMLALLRKIYLPELDPEAPPHQIIDFWLILKLEDKTLDDAYAHIIAGQKVIDYLDSILSNLGGEDKKVIPLSEMTDTTKGSPIEIYSSILARNTIVSHVEQMGTQIKILSEQKLDEGELKKKAEKDSAK